MLSLKQCKKCNLDIGDIVRIKCATCSDMELCVECFADGAELEGHKKDHPYLVLVSLASSFMGSPLSDSGFFGPSLLQQERPDFPVFDENWSAEEELLLLEGIDTYGMGNWADISEFIASKTVDETKDHYFACYLNSPTFPLPVRGGSFFFFFFFFSY